MKTFIVGGAVRDQLLGLAVSDRDWVVVGATPNDLLDKGYQQVGRDFPVFLHPETKEEYALARTERKQGPGHTGFEVFASKDITLEQDLLRRDLTINAIAQTDDGTLIDPYNGLTDINQRVLRHVSEAFSEDPLRVLRVARFHAKLYHLGFTLANETRELMKSMARSGELNSLSAERVWQEWHKALAQTSPQQFIQTLYETDALAALMPELDSRFLQHDNMLDVSSAIGQRTLNALRYAADRQLPVVTRWAIVTHGLDSFTQPKNVPTKVVRETGTSHRGDKNKKDSNQLINTLCERMKVPNEFRSLAILGANYSGLVIHALEARPDTLIDLLDACDAWRKPSQFEHLLQCCEALISTNPEQSHKNLGSIALLRTAQQQCQNIGAQTFIEQGISGAAIGESIRSARKIQIASLKQQFKSTY